MYMRYVRADGQVNRHRDAVFVRHGEDAEIGVFHFNDAAGKKLSGSFAVTDAYSVRKFRDVVEIFSRFFGHAELAFAKTGFHIFGSVAGQRDFKIVNKRSAVHSDAGDETTFHQIDQNGTEADLDDMAADSPENRSSLFACNMNSAEEIAKIFDSEKVGERIQESCERRVRAGRPRKITDADFALARSERIGAHRAKRQRLDIVSGHGRRQHFNGKERTGASKEGRS